MGREKRAEHDGYREQNPTDVTRQLAGAAKLFSDVLARLSADDWDRTVVSHYPRLVNDRRAGSPSGVEADFDDGVFTSPIAAEPLPETQACSAEDRAAAIPSL